MTMTVFTTDLSDSELTMDHLELGDIFHIYEAETNRWVGPLRMINDRRGTPEPEKGKVVMGLGLFDPGDGRHEIHEFSGEQLSQKVRIWDDVELKLGKPRTTKGDGK